MEIKKNQELIQQIEEKEVTEALRNMKNGKATVLDNISVETFRVCEVKDAAVLM